LATQRPHVPADSLWATIEAIAAAPAPVDAEELARTTGVLPVPRMRHRLHVLADWGVLRMRRGAAGRKFYSVPAATRLLLADLAEPARIDDPGYRAAAKRLGPLLAQNANLLPDSPRTPALLRALAAVHDLETGPLGRSTHVPADSLRGTLLALAAAGRPVSAAWLARGQELRERGVVHRLAVLHRWRLVHQEIEGDDPGSAPEAVHSLTQDASRLLAELADPAAIDPPEYRAAVEELVVLLGTPTSTETTATHEIVLAGLGAVAALSDGPLAVSARRTAEE
jgi:hypothetical protein